MLRLRKPYLAPDGDPAGGIDPPATDPQPTATEPSSQDDGFVLLPNGERVPAAEVIRWRQTHESLDGLQAELADRESALNQKLQQATAAEKEIEAARAVQRILETNPQVKKAFEQALIAGIRGDGGDAAATADAHLAATADAAGVDPRVVNELLAHRQELQNVRQAADEAKQQLAEIKRQRETADFESYLDAEIRRVVAEHPERYDYARLDQVRAALQTNPEQARRAGTIARVLKASHDEEMRVFEERLAKRQQTQQNRATANPAPPGAGATSQPAAAPPLHSDQRRDAMRASLHALAQQQAG